MKCPYCQSVETKVIDKRELEDNKVTRRRRECLKCTKRFTTYERIDSVDLVIIKTNQNREQFDRQKLKTGIMKACEKRPVSVETVESMITEIENHLRKMESTEIPSSVVGELIMEKLKDLDKVAYVRFASVYRKFRDANEFLEEVNKLVKDKKEGKQ